MSPLLVIQALLPGVAAGLLTLLAKNGPLKGKPEWLRQIVYGIVFGLVAVFATEAGVPVVDGGVVNVRDAAPVVASLGFGAPAGVIAGVIGAAERWLCVYWGGGMTTRLACSLATLIAGLGSAGLRRLVFDDKPPAMGFAMAIGVTTGVMHMLLVLVTNMDALEVAFEYVRECSRPMICLTGASTGIALIGRGVINHERLAVRPPYLINDLGIRLFLIVLVTFCGVTFFTYSVSGKLALTQAETLLRVHLDDLVDEVYAWGMSDLVGNSPVWRIQREGAVIIFDPDSKEVLTANGLGSRIDDESVIPNAPDRFTPNRLYRLEVFGESCYVMSRTIGWRSFVAYIPEEEADYFCDLNLYLSIFMEILVHMALFIILFQLMRLRVVKNLRRVGEGLDAIAEGKLDTVVDVRTHQEFCALSDDVNATVSVLKGYITEAEMRNHAELEFARQIQHGSLPSVFPPYPDRKDFDIYASMDAAFEVGGDFYDFFLADKRTLVFLVADVSGKGVPAALLMMKAKALIRSLMGSGMEVDVALTRANDQLCESNDLGMFVTAWLGRLDLETGVLTYANAGHNPPLVRRGGTWSYLRGNRPNLVLAGLEGTKYARHELVLGPGSGIFLYTDGVTEAMNVDEALYGESRLEEKLNDLAAGTPREVCEGVLGSVREFSGEAEQSDDITMLAVGLGALVGETRVVTDATMGSVGLVSEFFEERLHSLGVGARTAMRAQVAVDEAYSNICRYSGASSAVASVLRRGDDLLVEFCDDGAAFDPTAKEEPDTTLSVEERPIGGLGIHMMRKLARSLEYRRVDDTNIFTLVFALD